MTDEITVRNATPADLDEVMRVEREAWPPEIQAPREKFESRMKIFPQGFYVAFHNDKMVGVTTSEIIRYDGKNHPKTWMDVTDNGWIRMTHDAGGNALYVVSVGASLQGKGVGSKLVEAQKELVKKLELDCLILGARCPDYHNSDFDNVPADKYIRMAREDKQPVDKEIRFYTRCGLNAVTAMPDYMGKGEDRESRDYGVIMVWKNPEKK